MIDYNFSISICLCICTKDNDNYNIIHIWIVVIIYILNMPISVVGNSSKKSDHKTDTSLFVQKPYIRTNYIEANIEEDIDLKNQFRIKNLPDPISIREAASKNYIDNLLNDPSVVKNTAHIDLNDRNVTNARFIQVNQWPQIDSLNTKVLC